jgi:hypothetical protein
MPVNSTHADYDANLPAWVRARDVFAGEDAVKAAAEKYLPRLDLQDDNDYLAYKTRASFFNASARTADGFVGLIFRREPISNCPMATTVSRRRSRNLWRMPTCWARRFPPSRRSWSRKSSMWDVLAR